MSEPVDILLFCPHCGEQHVDEAQPGVCETCGHTVRRCNCSPFTEWLNPPHKSHRCGFCNHVWRPSDVPTNGVLTLKTKGERDGNPRPRYFYTAKDYEDAIAAARESALEEAAQIAETCLDEMVGTKPLTTEEFNRKYEADIWKDTPASMVARIIRKAKGAA
jgi:hypothetical protein